MTPETVIDVMSSAIQLGAVIAGPILLISLITGVTVSIFQAATQINDQTLVTVPKIVVTLLTLVLLGSWMLGVYVDFTRQMLLSLPTLGR